MKNSTYTLHNVEKHKINTNNNRNTTSVRSELCDDHILIKLLTFGGNLHPTFYLKQRFRGCSLPLISGKSVYLIGPNRYS